MSADDDTNVHVYLRIRPLSPQEEENGNLKLLSRPNPRTFTYDHVAGTASTQVDVFERVGKPITDACLRGYNGTIFAYGQTGSGKTWTIQGPADIYGDQVRSGSNGGGGGGSGGGSGITMADDNAEVLQTHNNRGVMPRVFEYLMAQIARRQRMAGESLKYLIKASFLEIYNDRIYDLLDPQSFSLKIHEDIKRGVYVANLTEQTITTASNAMEIMKIGVRNRRVGATAMNRESSRSHSVFSLVIQSTETVDGLTTEKYSRFHLIDLAGSERQKSTDAAGVRLKEASRINRSLSALGNVIMALVDIARGKQRHVHYRDSQLTFLLKDSLGGNSLTHIVACVSPADSSFGETLSTLKFAKRAKFIKNRARINEDQSGTLNVLQKENQRLRDQLRQLKTLQDVNVRRMGLSFTTPRKSMRTFHPHLSGVDEEDGSNGENCSGIGGGSGRMLEFDVAESAASMGQHGTSHHELRETLHHALERENRCRDEINSLQAKIQNLEKLREQMRMHVLSSQMMLKLRERTIGNLQEQLKNLRNTAASEHVISAHENMLKEQVERLEKEREQFAMQLKHHPQVIERMMQVIDLEDRVHFLESILVVPSSSAANSGEQEVDTDEAVNRINEMYEFNFKLSKKVSELLAEHDRLVAEAGDMRAQMASPGKLLQSMSTPQRRKYESFELEKWKKTQNFQRKLAKTKKCFDEQIAALECKLQQEVQHSTDSQECATQLRRRVDDMEQRVEGQSLRHEADRNNLIREHELHVEDIRARHKTRVARLTESHASNVDALKKVYEEQMAELENGKKKATDEAASRVRIELAELRGVCDRLHAELEQRGADHRDLKETELRLHTRIDELVTRLKTAQADLHEQLQHAATREAGVEQQRADLAVQVRSLEMRIVESEAATLSAQDDHRVALGALQETEKALASTRERLESQQVTVRELETAEGELSSKISSLESVIEDKNAQLDQAHFRHELLQEDHDTMMNQFEFAQSQLSEMKEKHARLQQLVDSHETEVERLQRELGVERDQSTELSDKFDRLAEEHASFDVNQLLREKKEADSALQRANEELSLASADTDELQSAVHEQQRQIDALEGEKRDLQDALDDLRSALTSLQAKYRQQGDVLRTAQQQVHELGGKLADSEQDSADKDAHISSITTDLSELSDALETEAQQHRQEVADVMGELDTLQTKCDDTVRELCEHTEQWQREKREWLEERHRLTSQHMCELRQAHDHVEQARQEQARMLAEHKETSGAAVDKLETVRSENASIKCELEHIRLQLAKRESQLEEKEIKLQSINALLGEAQELRRRSLSALNSSSDSVTDGMDSVSNSLACGNDADVDQVRQTIFTLEQRYIGAKSELSEATQRHARQVERLSADIALLSRSNESSVASHELALQQLSEDRERYKNEAAEMRLAYVALKKKSLDKEQTFVHLADKWDVRFKSAQADLKCLQETLEARISELSAVQVQRDSLRARVSELSARSESDSVMLRARVSELEKTQSDAEMAREQVDSLAVESARHASDATRLREQLVSSLEAKKQWLAEMARCREEEQRTFDASQAMRSELESLRNAHAGHAARTKELQQDNERLLEQNTRLIGHQNPKQKIQLHMKIKKENDQLKREKLKLQRQLRVMARQLNKENMGHIVAKVATKSKPASSRSEGGNGRKDGNDDDNENEGDNEDDDSEDDEDPAVMRRKLKRARQERESATEELCDLRKSLEALVPVELLNANYGDKHSGNGGCDNDSERRPHTRALTRRQKALQTKNSQNTRSTRVGGRKAKKNSKSQATFRVYCDESLPSKSDTKPVPSVKSLVHVLAGVLKQRTAESQEHQRKVVEHQREIRMMQQRQRLLEEEHRVLAATLSSSSSS